MAYLAKTLILLFAASAVLPHPAPPSPLSPAELSLTWVYNNFTLDVAKAINDNDIDMMAEIPAPGDSGSPCPGSRILASSSFALNHILAIANEKLWEPMGIPVFEGLLKATPKTLPDSYEFVFKRLLQDSDVTFSSFIFTGDKLEKTDGLTKLKAEIVETDLTKPESKDSINTKISTFLGTTPEIQYIPKDSTLSPAASAIVVDSFHITESWSTPATKVENPPKFRTQETVDMVEIKGSDIQVLENEEAVEVFMHFKNNRRALSLVMIYDGNATDLGQPKPQNYASVRLQLPVFRAEIRASEANLTSKCDFDKTKNFLQLLDHVIVVSLSADKFEAISITGGQVNNIEKFKGVTPGSKTAPTCPNPTGLDVLTWSGKVKVPAGADERLITFDRPFTWTVIDQDLGPIFGGSVFSTIHDTNSPSPSTPSVFGFESPLGFAKCF